ncbi:hypothetical protein CYLTODRAFT_488110 [Cylindrobasidium torrendii FP15055 ss-10]|uniref:Mif2/CENP-C cupin domain-containing protein n=1 Tax=Cylindrobasidium torrendii FP15055 ss-10 TaxID=1314674 RepID=A0A0D7BJZ4_9AGAR|nr:hypothetical protein CYLTODRAFT_488110 [Cylindrobasidium torrendii FP15055 ss-10]
MPHSRSGSRSSSSGSTSPASFISAPTDTASAPTVEPSPEKPGESSANAQERTLYDGSSATSDRTVTPAPSALSFAPPPPLLEKKNKKARRTESHASEVDPAVSEVLVYGSDNVVAKRRVVFPAKLVKSMPATVPNEGFAVLRALSDSSAEGTFVASGHLEISGSKSPKNTHDNTFIFYVVEGAVTVRIHKSYHTVTAGDLFLIPRENTYSIENISDKPSRLVFTQTRESSSSTADPLRLVKRAKLPNGITTSKAFILLGWILERVLKRANIYKKFALLYARRGRFYWNQHIHGTRAYLVFFILGWLVRSMPVPWGSHLNPPRVNIQFIKDTPKRK